MSRYIVSAPIMIRLIAGQRYMSSSCSTWVFLCNFTLCSVLIIDQTQGTISAGAQTHMQAHTIKERDVRACEPINANKDYICLYDYRAINHASFWSRHT